MPLKTQADILNIAGQAAAAGGVPGIGTANPLTAGNDWIKDLNNLAGQVKDIVSGLQSLADKTGLPLIGENAAIRRLAPPRPADAPPARQAGPLLPAPPETADRPAQAAPPAAPGIPAVDWAAVLDKAAAYLDQKGLSGISVGQALNFLADKKLGDLVKGAKDGLKPKG